jgi:predicted CxxxxCH...CXXCH cytochrome family protein
MSSITSLLKILCVSAACCALFGCGKHNDQAPVLESIGKHPDTWLTGHRASYRRNPEQCRECHGIDLKGGITKVDCFNQAGLGQCHAGGHGPRSINHPLPFTDPALHGPVARVDLIFCQDCHGTAGGTGSNPRFDLVIGSLKTGCEATGCHDPKMAHPKPWATHGSSGNQANACALCHGANFGGGSGPACSSCHKQLAAGTIPVLGQCISCHGNPPNGSTTPNRNGSHAVHIALPKMSGNCAACHTNGGSGTDKHGSTLTLAFASDLNANSGLPAFNGTTCANISCHGGLTTPAWGRSLDILTSCSSCHQPGTSEYIGYFSGQHTFHLGIGIICTDCHLMSNDSAHFGDVTTKVFETLPSATLRSFINYNVNAVLNGVPNPSCSVSSPPPPGVQFTACHAGTRNWR